MRRAARAALAALALCAVAGAEQAGAPPEGAPLLEPTELSAPPADPDALLRTNVQDPDGWWAYVHFTPEDAPIVVAVGMPREPPRDGSRADGRKAVLDGVRVWVRALRPYVPWFAVRFVEEDPKADVTIEWKRRITGPYSGFGGIDYRIDNGALRVFERRRM